MATKITENKSKQKISPEDLAEKFVEGRLVESSPIGEWRISTGITASTIDITLVLYTLAEEVKASRNNQTEKTN